eukprot:6194473-Pleurochrysis_carterae.AAC.2
MANACACQVSDPESVLTPRSCSELAEYGCWHKCLTWLLAGTKGTKHDSSGMRAIYQHTTCCVLFSKG